MSNPKPPDASHPDHSNHTDHGSTYQPGQKVVWEATCTTFWMRNLQSHGRHSDNVQCPCLQVLSRPERLPCFDILLRFWKWWDSRSGMFSHVLNGLKANPRLVLHRNGVWDERSNSMKPKGRSYGDSVVFSTIFGGVEHLWRKTLDAYCLTWKLTWTGQEMTEVYKSDKSIQKFALKRQSQSAKDIMIYYNKLYRIYLSVFLLHVHTLHEHVCSHCLG